MDQISKDMELNLLEQKINARLSKSVSALQVQIDDLAAPVTSTDSFVTPPNYLPNSMPEWSTMAYTTAATTAATAGDTNRECYNWYRQTAATTALAASAANALKRSVGGAQHSLWAANEGANSDIPIWDGENSTMLMGGSTTKYDISSPLLTDFVNPGHTYYVYFEAALAGSSIDVPTGLQVYAGFWDNTGGQQKWLEGSDFTPIAANYGIPGSRTIEYKIKATTDSGAEILSAAVTITTAPSTLSSDNHVRLSFSGAPGFILYEIYRKVAGVYYRVGIIKNSIDLQFFDMVESGDTVVMVAGYPSVSGNRPQAYAITSEFVPGDLSVGTFAPHVLTIAIPTTYNKSNTTVGNQWFRFGVDELMASGDERGIVIRRLMVSEGFGAWTKHSKDFTAASSPTGTPASSPPSGGTTTDPPPEGGSGRPECVAIDTVTQALVDGEVVDTTFEQVEKDSLLVCGAMALKVRKAKQGTVQEGWELHTENGLALTCTGTHRLIRSHVDRTGISVSVVKIGEFVLTCVDGVFAQSHVVRKIPVLGEIIIKSVDMPAPHLFIANGFVCHNRKVLE